jgi:hypothetical protein
LSLYFFESFLLLIALYFFSHPFCLSGADIIVLDYIIKGKLISKLEENETVSLKFSKKLETKQVSKDYNNLNPRWSNLAKSPTRAGSYFQRTSHRKWPVL